MAFCMVFWGGQGDRLASPGGRGLRYSCLVTDGSHDCTDQIPEHEPVLIFTQ
jgi:hypothetical protein